MNPKEQKPLERPPYTLSPIQEAAIQFCYQYGLNRNAFTKLCKLFEAAYESQAVLEYTIAKEEAEARQRMEKHAIALFGIDAFDKEPLKAN